MIFCMKKMSEWTRSGALLFVLLLFALSTSSASAAQRIAEFSGERNTETAEFEVRAPFLVDWIAFSDYPQSMALTIALIDAKTGTHEGYIVKTKAPGNGLRLVEESGTYRIRVDASFARWLVKIDQLSRSEAEQYKPRSNLDY